MNGAARSWVPHLICLALLAVECGVWGLGHRGEAELQAAARDGSPRERIAALHVLTNRGEPAPGRFDAAFAQALVDDPDELLREYAFTTDVCKHADPRPQYRYLKQLREQPSDPRFWRGFVLHRRKIGVVTGGSSARLKLRELDWYFAALRGERLPGDEVLRYIEANP